MKFMIRFIVAVFLFSSTLTFGDTPAAAPKQAKATFAGGCFWSMDRAFDKLPGVISVVSGYAGGNKANPTYEEVESGTTGHAESIDVTYDPSKTTYEKLLDAYWHTIDPTQADGQFCDIGSQYRSAIFYHDETQHKLAEASKAEVEKTLKTKVVTMIVPAKQFYPAEEYHQDFYKKNPIRYNSYRVGCGRDRRLVEIWGSAAPAH
ncbi:MAG TPA: peptide-methionine (S)-S-oxide reductase MsrA [Acidobacteriota bacterium]|nr:peptide-methionine (S)-S-oxide reductase MsrA [Acidobacteriota bacterium]